MKISSPLFVLSCCALLAACSAEAPSAAPAQATTAGGARAPLEDEYALKQQLRPFMSDRRVYEDTQVVAALAATRVAQMEWVKARDAHPALKAQVEKAEGLMSRATREAQSGDSDLAKQLATEAGMAKAELEQMALRLPDLTPLNQARQAAQREVERAQIEALKTLPEARALAERWEALLDGR
ncbi:hypothetical protein [Aquimonas voraii]|uniref:DUF4398 domain-containing protein n=1 Tax=Aquimonas voraii TaxID=265719 RepID=A0A1G6U2I7_9GAMM|nr:hypothetical protein [Aquimonas voraii]SDD35622.1 hypothetical protein SAMN04488509_102134 [Aquimonas voraii]